MDYSKLPWAILFLFITGVAIFVFWKTLVWFYKNYMPKPSTGIHSGQQASSMKSLVEMKKLLDEKLITQEEFDQYKKSTLEKIQ